MKNRKSPKYYIIVIACFICLIVAACIVLPRLLSPANAVSSNESTEPATGVWAEQYEVPEITETQSEHETSGNEQTTADDTPAVPSTPIEIDMSKLHLIDLDLAYVMDQGRVYPDPESCVDIVWEESDIVAYYGTNLVPSYLPADLQASESNNTQQVVLSKEGEVWEDTVWLNFYHDYFEDGSPRLTEDIPAPKGFHLNASKIGLLKEFNFVLSEEDAQISDIGGTPVIIGYQSKPYGPYTEDTHEPAGYYDFYVVQFTLNGVEYELVFEQIELEEVVKVVASVIN